MLLQLQYLSITSWLPGPGWELRSMGGGRLSSKTGGSRSVLDLVTVAFNDCWITFYQIFSTLSHEQKLFYHCGVSMSFSTVLFELCIICKHSWLWLNIEQWNLEKYDPLSFIRNISRCKSIMNELNHWRRTRIFKTVEFLRVSIVVFMMSVIVLMGEWRWEVPAVWRMMIRKSGNESHHHQQYHQQYCSLKQSQLSLTLITPG